jgi:Kef-type K+ transport system membrane component KefB
MCSPSTKDTLVLSSFFVLLQVARVISHKILKVGTIGFIAVGVLYGAPITNLLLIEWQETFVAIGYLGLNLLVFEGALFTNIWLLTRNISLSAVCAVTGVLMPIGLSMLLLVVGFGYTTIQALATGASLSATSLGTTVAVLKAGSTSPQPTWFSASVTTVLLSAATIDDIIGLVMASVTPSLGTRESSTLGWAIGRPVLAPIGLAIVTAITLKLTQLFSSTTLWISRVPERHRSRTMFICMVACLTGLTTAAAYSGTSILFGSFAAGILFSYIDTLHEGSHAGGETHPQSPSPSFRTVFRLTIAPVQESVFAPLFFASIGFAIPFRDLWQPVNAWHGITYAILMFVGKFVVGVWIPVWSILWPIDGAAGGEVTFRPNSPQHTPRNSLKNASKAGILLGSGMVARGEIGLLIVQLGYDSGNGPIPYDLYIVAIWALVLNTIVGPILVAATLSRWGNPIMKGSWGIARVQTDDIHSEVHEMPPVPV